MNGFVSDNSSAFCSSTVQVPAPPANTTRQIMLSLEPVTDPVRQTVISDVNSDGTNITTVDVSGTFPCGPAGARCSDATKMSVGANTSHSFILLARQGMFEIYLDGLLVQYLPTTFVFKT